MKISFQTIPLSIILYQILFVPIIYISLARKEPFREYIELSPLNAPKEIQFIITLVLVLIVTAYIILAIRQKTLEKISIQSLLLILTPLLIFFVIAPPLFSRDITAYFISARDMAVYKQDTYLTPISSIKENSWSTYGKGIWSKPSVYGPVFNLIMISFFIISSPYILVYVTLYKIILLIFVLINVYLLAKISTFLNSNNLATKLFILNPSILIHLILDGHNDTIILSLILLSIYLYLSKKYLISYLSLALSIGIKYFSIILYPILWIKNQKPNLRAIITSTLTTGLVFTISSIFFNGFWENLLSGRHVYYAEYCFLQCFPFITLLHFLFGTNAIVIRYLLFSLGWVYLIYKFLILNNKKILFSFWTFLLFSTIITSWLSPWLLTYAITFSLLLLKNKKYLYISLILTAYSIFHYLGI